MNPVELAIQVRALASARPFDFPALIRVIEQADGLLEQEIAGALAFRLMPLGELFSWICHADPHARRSAARFLGQLGNVGASVLRHLAVDSDSRVACIVRRLVRELELRDVALPTPRPRRLWRTYQSNNVGDWNPSGWSRGKIRATHRTWRRPVVFPSALLRELNVTPSQRRQFWSSLGGRAYIEFQIPKRTGHRIIAAPKHSLKVVQRRLLDEFFSTIPLHEAAHGFRRGRSIVTNAQQHVGARFIVSMDLQNFFPSIHQRRVLGFLLSLGVTGAEAAVVSELVTWRAVTPDKRVLYPGVLPQGAPTSPAIANLIAHRLDARLTGLAKRFGAAYTRYADDLSFSFSKGTPQHLGRFLWWANAICQQEGFIENASKRRIQRPGARQEVTGLVVNQRVSVPRHVRRRVRAILHNVRRDGLEKHARGKSVHEFADWLRGMVAYVVQVHPELRAWIGEVKALLAKEGLR